MTEVIKPKMMDYHRHLLICIGERCSPNGEGQALYDTLSAKFKAVGLNAGDFARKA